MSKKTSRVAASFCAVAIAGGGAGAAAVALTHDSSSKTVTVAAATPAASNVASGSALTVGQIAKESSPGVVEIDATSTTSGSTYPGSGGTSAAAEGTGFVYDLKGDIVTNDHVVQGASSISVKFPDGSTYKATVVGADPSSDLAVIHVNAPASKLTVLQLGDSSTVAVGDGVVAIGNPFGLDNTVTSGIVSALNREITSPDESPIEGAIQTDAAINHGNSGGPLLNGSAQVIGVNAQIQSDSGGNDGVGFAIASNMVKNVSTQLVAGQTVQHAYLGVQVGDSTTGSGAELSTIKSGSPASRAGLQAGDVVTAIDGNSVSNADDLTAQISAHAPNDVVTLTVTRNGKSQQVKVTLGVRPS